RLNWPPPDTLLPPTSPIITPGADFADTKLVEISRGCPYHCRFCLAGAIFRPHRPWPLSSILKALGPPEVLGEKVGLVSAAAADHPEIGELLDILHEQKRIVTLSSLRLTAITPKLAARLAQGQLRGVAIAPEGGSQKMRNSLNKKLKESEILEAARLLAEAGLTKIKLYFIIGLPDETDDDLNALIDLCRQIRQSAKVGKAAPFLTVSLANFTPKGHTPFENAPMNTEKEFKRKGQLISQALKSELRLSVNFDPPLWSIAQGLLARGGLESCELVHALWANDGRLKPALKAVGYTPDHPIHHPWPQNHPKPWQLIKP
ncbi:MAG: radical SAM protein, partial [Candidatus Adiutrix sp.]